MPVGAVAKLSFKLRGTIVGEEVLGFGLFSETRREGQQQSLEVAFAILVFSELFRNATISELNVP